VNHVERVEDDLLKKEIKLEKQIESKHDSWGEEFGMPHAIHMEPLFPHI